jgi:hypothetical protein
MTIKEMEKLNSELVYLIKHRRKMAAKDMARVLCSGDKVLVTDRNGTEAGTIQRVMRTRAVVRMNGMNYRVPMSMIAFEGE